MKGTRDGDLWSHRRISSTLRPAPREDSVRAGTAVALVQNSHRSTGADRLDIVLLLLTAALGIGLPATCGRECG